MSLIDTNVISAARKGPRANPGVRAFFAAAIAEETRLHLSVVTIGEQIVVGTISDRHASRFAATVDSICRASATSRPRARPSVSR